jgi:type II secretory pathway component PulC
MNSVKWTLRALVGPGFLLLACAGAGANDRDEHKASESSLLDAESPAGLPFSVAGTLTAPPTKFAVISMTSSGGQAGPQMLASEGEVVAEYRLISIHSDRVVFERDGHAFFVRVGTERQNAPTPAPTTSYVRKRTAPLTVVAPPENLEEIRQQIGTFVDLLKANPEFQKGLDDRMRRVRERGGASQ